MSRKKYPHNEHSVGGRLRVYREAKGYTVAEFSSVLGISQGSLSDIENNKTKPSAKPVEFLVQNSDIDIYWLFTGYGEMLRIPQEKKVEAERENRNAAQNTDADTELLGMTREVLNSGTEYADSLAANIRSFHNAVNMYYQLQDHEARLQRIEGQGSLSEKRARNGTNAD